MLQNCCYNRPLNNQRIAYLQITTRTSSIPLSAARLLTPKLAQKTSRENKLTVLNSQKSNLHLTETRVETATNFFLLPKISKAAQSNHVSVLYNLQTELFREKCVLFFIYKCLTRNQNLFFTK